MNRLRSQVYASLAQGFASPQFNSSEATPPRCWVSSEINLQRNLLLQSSSFSPEADLDTQGTNKKDVHKAMGLRAKGADFCLQTNVRLKESSPTDTVTGSGGLQGSEWQC